MMNYRQVVPIAILCAILTFELCETNAIKFKLNPNRNEEENYHQSKNPRSVSSVNATDSGEKVFNVSMPMTPAVPISNIKIADQKYSQNTSGEYKLEVLFSNGNWRAEQGEYEDHNGVIVFVIRGVFSYHTREGTYNTTLYIVDEFGYHNVQPPTQLTQEGIGSVDYRPDIQTASECDNEKGTYCIDPKLLALLVG